MKINPNPMSPVARTLINVLYNRPDAKYSSIDLASITGLPVAEVRRLMHGLEKEKLVLKELTKVKVNPSGQATHYDRVVPKYYVKRGINTR